MWVITPVQANRIMPRARVNGMGCSRSSDRLETDGGQVRHALKVDHLAENTLQALNPVQVSSAKGGYACTAVRATHSTKLCKQQCINNEVVCFHTQHGCDRIKNFHGKTILLHLNPQMNQPNSKEMQTM